MSNIAKNWFFLILTAVLQHGALAVTLIYLANKTSPEVYGQFSSIWAVINIGMLIAFLGLNRIATREIAADPNSHTSIMKLYPWILVVTTTLSIIGIIAYLYGAEGITDVQLLGFSVFYFILFVIINFFETVFYGHSKFIQFGVIGGIGSLILVVLTVIFLSEHQPLRWIFLFLTVSTFVKIPLLITFYLRLPRQKEGGKKYTVKNLLGMSLPFYGTLLLGIPFLQLPVLLISQFSGSTEAGYYGIITKFSAPFLVLTLNLNTILFSKFSRDYSLGKKDFPDSVSMIFNFLLGFSGISIILVSIFSREIIEIFVGAKYLPASDTLLLNWWVTLMAVIHNFIGTVMLAAGKERLLMRLSIINSVLMTVAIYFSAHYGAFGSLVGMWLGYFLFLGYLLYITGVRTVQFVSVQKIIFILIFILFFTVLSYQISLFSVNIKIGFAVFCLLCLGIILITPKLFSAFQLHRIFGIFKGNKEEGAQ